jgi:dienelactone hydrolase
MDKPSPEHVFRIPADGVSLDAIITIPRKAHAVVLLAQPAGDPHGNLSYQLIGDRLHEAGCATLRFDLVTPVEAGYSESYFDIKLLTERLEAVTHWLIKKPPIRLLSLGYFTDGTGTAAALCAAAHLKPEIKAIVSCGGRPDRAVAALPQVDAPTLLIAGGEDHAIARINQKIGNLLSGEVEIEIVPGATNLFMEPALGEVARLTCHWFSHHLKKKTTKK